MPVEAEAAPQCLCLTRERAVSTPLPSNLSTFLSWLMQYSVWVPKISYLLESVTIKRSIQKRRTSALLPKQPSRTVSVSISLFKKGRLWLPLCFGKGFRRDTKAWGIYGFISFCLFVLRFELHCLFFRLYANKHLSLVVYKSLPKENLTTVLSIYEKIVSSCKVVSLCGSLWLTDWLWSQP